MTLLCQGRVVALIPSLTLFLFTFFLSSPARPSLASHQKTVMKITEFTTVTRAKLSIKVSALGKRARWFVNQLAYMRHYCLFTSVKMERKKGWKEKRKKRKKEKKKNKKEEKRLKKRKKKKKTVLPPPTCPIFVAAPSSPYHRHFDPLPSFLSVFASLPTHLSSFPSSSLHAGEFPQLSS